MSEQIQKWLSCKISPGQFSGEFAVSAPDFQDVEFSLFVADDFVDPECGEVAQGVECSGHILVDIMEVRGDLSLVRLPGRTFTNGFTVTVHSSQLTSAASHA